jgi:hypothetical protein
MSAHVTSPLSAAELIGEYFIENRNRLLEIAAFLDRIDRAGTSEAAADFRMQAFREAVAALTDAAPKRLAEIQLIFSDPTTEPLPALDRKGALGAYDPAREGSRS